MSAVIKPELGSDVANPQSPTNCHCRVGKQHTKIHKQQRIDKYPLFSKY